MEADRDKARGPGPGGLPPFTAARLGPERAAQALGLRRRLLSAGVAWPAWIDERPGLLEVVIGDCAADPPLCESARSLALFYGAALLRGLGALALAAAAPRMAIVARDEAARAELARLAAGTGVEVYLGPPVWPSQPDLDVPGAAGHAWVVKAGVLDRAGAALLGQPAHPLCTVAGAVRRPQVVALEAGQTPMDLVRRCGGGRDPAWVAVAGGAPYGRLWEAGQPLDPSETMLLVLPPEHDLVRRLRTREAEWLCRVASVCQGCRLCTEACPEDLRGGTVEPHALVALLAGGEPATRLGPPPKEGGEPATRLGPPPKEGGEPATRLGPPPKEGGWRANRANRANGAGTRAAQALSCTGCGVCDAICPGGIAPGQLVTRLRDRLLEAGVAPPPPGPGSPGPPGDAGLRRLPLDLLAARLGLSPDSF